MRGMRAPSPLLLLFALWTGRVVVQDAWRGCASAEELDFLQVRALSPSESLRFVVTRATFGAALPRISSSTQDLGDRDSSALEVVYGDLSDDCSQATLLPSSSSVSSFAVLLDRGGSCSFVQKAVAVQNAGASLLIVRDTILGAFASATQTGTAMYDCTLGSGVVTSNASFPLIGSITTAKDAAEVASCTNAHACATDTCVLTGAHDRLHAASHYQVCCFENRMIRMNADGASHQLVKEVSIPAVFLNFRDAETLEQLLMVATSSTSNTVLVKAYNSEESPWNVSMLLSWLLGVCVVTSAAYYSCRDERSFSYQKMASALAKTIGRSASSDMVEDGYVSIDDGDRGEGFTRASEHGGGMRGADKRYELSGRHALYFLLGASSVLLLLYYVDLLLVISILFAIGASAAMTQVIVFPLCSAVLPASLLSSSSSSGKNSHVLVLSGVVAALISLFWFVERTSPSIWPLQDLLCISLCFVFIDTIQLPSLRVGTILLSVAFVYDIFFVYVSPYLFGSNVMIDVASGGGNTRVRGFEYCDQHPEASECHHEIVPMVLSIPLLFSFYGGNALLGLGDLIIPGLLVSFCIRYDYCTGYPLSRKYFCVASVAYALGLFLANTMAILLRDVVAGQPALMYIVPFMLIAVLGFANANGELESMWTGPRCLDMTDDGLRIEDSESIRRNEKQPLVTTR